MVTIHHSAFPHLIDMVFDFADPTALLLMAKVCRGWRDRVLRKFHHVCCLSVIDALPDVLSISLDYPGQRQLKFGKEAVGLLAGCRVLDVGEDEPPSRFVHNASGKPFNLLPNLDTVRYSTTSDVTLFARQLVFNDGWSPIATGSPIVKRLVVHWSDDFGYEWEYVDVGSLSGLQDLIIINECVPGELEPYNNGALDIESLVVHDHISVVDLPANEPHPRVQLNALRWTVKGALSSGVTVILVGMEELSPKVFDAIGLGVEQIYVSGEVAFSSQGSLSLMTIEGYRDFVGEKEWAVQTNEDNLTP